MAILVRGWRPAALRCAALAPLPGQCGLCLASSTHPLLQLGPAAEHPGGCGCPQPWVFPALSLAVLSPPGKQESRQWQMGPCARV